MAGYANATGHDMCKLTSPSSPNYDPGGMLTSPKPSGKTLLDVQITPRHSIYVSSENTAEFIVDALFSDINGVPYTSGSSDILSISITTNGGSKHLASSHVTINTAGNVIVVDLTGLQARSQPYDIVLSGGPQQKSTAFTVRTELFYLPEKRTGSMVKIDNLNGGMLFANNVSDYQFEPLLPFGFYTDCSGYLNLSFANVEAYKNLGFNAINPVCAYTDGDLDFLFDEMDQINLLFQYDMRGSYQNLTLVADQIPLIKDHSSFLSYYTADEPDGWQYPLNSTQLAYNLITSMDKYHPVGLVLNCENYYFKEYTAGVDYIMEDAYPVGINATYSRPFDTPCNITYGDCGCDDCVGELQDVSHRLDDFFNYQTWLGQNQKPLWAVPQAFSGEGYWSRDPTPQEAWAMNLLAFNHRAKAIMAWTFPPSSALATAHSEMAKVFAVPPVSTFLLGGQPTAISVPKHPLLDAAYWKLGNQVLVSIVNPNHAVISQAISVPLSGKASGIQSQPWGSTAWKLSADGTGLVVGGLDALATSAVLVVM
ncbi:hypothetical protein MMC25_001597 [Agyrium rufum]|nr:hypothetical protein [Agyrium rufum]